MRKTIKVSESSLLYRKIDELALSELDRVQAVAALKAADRLADAYYWMVEMFDRAAALLTSGTRVKQRTFKHQ